MTYKKELKFIATDIVKSKGHKVFLHWSRKKKDVDELVNSLNNKINNLAAQPIEETTEKQLFAQQQFEF